MLAPPPSQTSQKRCRCIWAASGPPCCALLGGSCLQHSSIVAPAWVTDALAAVSLGYFMSLSNLILSSFWHIHPLLETSFFLVFCDVTCFWFVSHCPSHPLSTSFGNVHPSACPSFCPSHSLSTSNIIHSLGLSYDRDTVTPTSLYLGSAVANCLADRTQHTTAITPSSKSADEYFQCFPTTLKVKPRFYMLF